MALLVARQPDFWIYLWDFNSISSIAKFLREVRLFGEYLVDGHVAFEKKEGRIELV